MWVILLDAHNTEDKLYFTFGNTDGLRGQIYVALGHTASTFWSP